MYQLMEEYKFVDAVVQFCSSTLGNKYIRNPIPF